MVVVKLSAICAAVEPSKRHDFVICTGIATFNEQGQLSSEATGGELEWKVSMKRPAIIKGFIQKYVQGNLQKTAGIVYQVDRDKIFIMSKAAYRATIKKKGPLPD